MNIYELITDAGLHDNRIASISLEEDGISIQLDDLLANAPEAMQPLPGIISMHGNASITITGKICNWITDASISFMGNQTILDLQLNTGATISVRGNNLSLTELLPNNGG